MDEDIKHGKDCDCTYCDKKVHKEFENILGTKAADLGDGLGNVTPDLHLFCEQSKSDVLKMFKQIADAKKRQEWPDGIMDAPAHHKPHLLCEDAPACSEDVRSAVCSRETKDKDAPENLALWRKLAGVRPQENVEAASKVPTIVDSILINCKRKFTSGLSVEMAEDHWNPCLVINGAKTKIRADDLVAALEGLQHITDEDEAARIVSNIVVKKIAGLFI